MILSENIAKQVCVFFAKTQVLIAEQVIFEIELRPRLLNTRM